MIEATVLADDHDHVLDRRWGVTCRGDQIFPCSRSCYRSPQTPVPTLNCNSAIDVSPTRKPYNVFDAILLRFTHPPVILLAIATLKPAYYRLCFV